MLRCLSLFRAAAVTGAALVLGAGFATAQSSHEPVRGATTAEVIGGNILIGGVVAATRALFTDADPLRAFTLGAFGGVVHIAGKNLTVEPGVAKAWAWLADQVSVGDSLDVSVFRFENYELDTSQYRTSVSLLSEFLWRVRITPASPAP